jgi:hypothetical protein
MRFFSMKIKKKTRDNYFLEELQLSTEIFHFYHLVPGPKVQKNHL